MGKEGREAGSQAPSGLPAGSFTYDPSTSSHPKSPLFFRASCVCCSRLRSSMATGEEFMVLADDPVLPRFSTRAAAFGCCCCLFTPPAGRDNCCTWTCPVAMPCRIIRRAPAAGRPRGEQLGVANQAIARGCFETRGDSAALPHETWTIWGSLFEGCNLWKNASICL